MERQTNPGVLAASPPQQRPLTINTPSSPSHSLPPSPRPSQSSLTGLDKDSTGATVIRVAKCLASLATLRTLWTAEFTPKRLTSMFTFWFGMIPTELPHHMLLLQLLALYKGWWGKAEALLPSRAPASPEEATAAREGEKATSVTVNSITEKVTLGAAVLSLYPLLRACMDQWTARSLMRRGLEEKGIPTENTGRPLSLTKAAICALPLPRFLYRSLVCRPGIIYGRAAKSPLRALRGKNGHPKDKVLFDLKLDLYWHENRKLTNAPIFCYIHGGGWVTGHRSHHSLGLLYEVARRGWVVASINYRLAPRSPYPFMLYDCKEAVHWLRTHAPDLGADPHFIVVGGESAGGHLALMMGLTGNVPALHPPPDPGYQGYQLSPDTSVQGVVDLYGVTDWTDSGLQYASRDNTGGGIRRFVERSVLRKQYEGGAAEFIRSSPFWWLFGGRLEAVLASAGVRVTDGVQKSVLSHEGGHELSQGVSAGTGHPSNIGIAFSNMNSDIQRESINDMTESRQIPPIFIAHGANDDLVPVEESQRFWQALQTRRLWDEDGGNPLSNQDLFLELPGAHHAFNFALSPRTFALGDAVCDWLESLWRKRGHSLTPPGTHARL